MKKISLLFAVLAILISGLVLTSNAFAKRDDDQEEHRPKVIICHATHSDEVNPFNQNRVDDDAIDGEGHGDHNRDGHQDGEDIIPPFYEDGTTGDWTPRNWDEEGQAIFRNDCNVPEDEDEGEEEEPEEPGEPEEPQTPPTTPPSNEVRVETPTSNPGPSVCTDVAPQKIPNIFVANAGKGALEVRWWPTGGQTAHILYGLEPGKPLYSLLDTPNDGNEVIRDLESGQHYWFAVTNGAGCAWSALSDWYDPIVE